MHRPTTRLGSAGPDLGIVDALQCLIRIEDQACHISLNMLKALCPAEHLTIWGQPLMNSLFTLGLMIGIQVSDMTVGTTIANLGMTDVKFPNPLFEGDTINCTTQVVSKRESKSRPGAGIVEFHHKAFKQDGTLVAECHRQAFMRMRPK